MSIPPLVCSTPPPPDQCEEDKDPEYFDIQYNVSQDDDDDDTYDYSNFSSYNHFQSTSATTKTIETENTTQHEDNNTLDNAVKNVEEYDDNGVVIGTNCTNNEVCKSEEDTNIEDLNLKVDEDSLNVVAEDCEELETDIVDKIKDEDVDKMKDDIPKTINIVCDLDSDSLTLPKPSEDNTIESSTDQLNSVEDVEHNFQELKESESYIAPNLPVTKCQSPSFDIVEPPKSLDIVDDDDDFGDFDDFQFVNPETKPPNVFETCDNPWENDNDANGSDFVNFTAHFDSPDHKTILHSNENETKAIENEDKQEDNPVSQEIIEDDDFGDFDDFKSSGVETEASQTTEEPQSCDEVPVLDFHSSENETQIIERINKVLSSIFDEEITKPENEFEGKLESLLSETWGHLIDTDVRQPYIVNWNNSLGQKTLLKSLCIDSRNILFGPKWSYNMPKYAANLTAAPLQPQKQQSSSNTSQNETVTADKPAPKPGGWTDPFTSNGQESCNSGNESPAIQITPSDLDVFEAAISTKSDKIYSNTPNLQPLRQINLPDTHIFTPTDSETPRSKTIHYDSGPPVLMPQPEDEVKNTDSRQLNSNVNDTEDNEYWEFQDYKGTPVTSIATPTVINETQATPGLENETDVNNSSKPNTSYQTQILQPIKMDLIMPTLNWPDPGEVKETFDDFSDFISKTTTWSNEKQDCPTNQENNSINIATENTPSSDDKKKIEPLDNVSNPCRSTDIDDEFDKFQSAIPPKETFAEFNNIGNHISNNITSVSPQISKRIPNFDYTFPKENLKTAPISVANLTRPNEALMQSSSYTSNTSEFRSKSPVPGFGLLQPTPAGSMASQNQQNSIQILQPLSLESYSQINWPSPGIDLQDLSRFNPVETLKSLKSDLSVSSQSRNSPIHSQKNVTNNQVSDDDVWGEFVSSKPKQAAQPKKAPVFADDDEWTEFVSSPNVKPQNGLNTISLNVHTNSSLQKTINQNSFPNKSQIPLDIPTLNYITPKASSHATYNNKHFQNL